MIRDTILILLAAALGMCCGGGLSADDKTAVGQIDRLSSLAYAHQDGGVGQALDRAIHCAARGIEARQKLPLPEGGLACPQ